MMHTNAVPLLKTPSLVVLIKRRTLVGIMFNITKVFFFFGRVSMQLQWHVKVIGRMLVHKAY